MEQAHDLHSLGRGDQAPVRQRDSQYESSISALTESRFHVCFMHLALACSDFVLSPRSPSPPARLRLAADMPPQHSTGKWKLAPFAEAGFADVVSNTVPSQVFRVPVDSILLFSHSQSYVTSLPADERVSFRFRLDWVEALARPYSHLMCAFSRRPAPPSAPCRRPSSSRCGSS